MRSPRWSLVLLLAACGGGGDDDVDAAAADATAAADGAPADAPVPTPDAPLADAGLPDGVPIACRPVASCTNDLSNIGTGDFSIAFTINTASTSPSGVIEQRAICMHSFFWGVRTGAGGGHLGFEYDDNNAHYRSFTSTGTINDGVDHAVLACRVSGTDYLYIDGVLDTTGPNTVDYSTTLSPLTTGTSPCIAFGDGTVALVGTVDDVCVGVP